MQESFISTQHLSVGYSHKKHQYLVQTNLELVLRKGELVCLIGPNGSGKSTLLRSLSGLQNIPDGAVFIRGKNLNRLSRREIAQQIALVLTDRINIENASVHDIVSLGRQPYTNWWGKISDDDSAKVFEAIKTVHLEQKQHRFMHELSDGERQRVMIAKALAQDTAIILLDEPTAHLDLPNRVEIMLLLHRLAHQTKKAILLSTHELDLALQAADKIWLMDNQKGIVGGIPEDLVLNGSFNNVFQNEHYTFNTANGNFSMNYPLDKEATVFGEKTRLYWTLRALARIGYRAVPNAVTQIEITDTSWKTGKQEFRHIENLLNYLS
ncbi:MAG: ABC transporter ATP-binding protein [Prevotellaceae bacterium]|jgi:iron complex transport system ATP-binding protein|nr:ABC transporter ATP-binding protein [Prevotellaceae bacterium]